MPDHSGLVLPGVFAKRLLTQENGSILPARSPLRSTSVQALSFFLPSLSLPHCRFDLSLILTEIIYLLFSFFELEPAQLRQGKSISLLCLVTQYLQLIFNPHYALNKSMPHGGIGE